MSDLSEYTFIFDIDGTICPIKNKEELYEDLVPDKKMLEKMIEYKECGAKIVLFSSRNMKTFSSCIGKINKYTAPTLIQWLEKWDIPYDEIYFGKPWPGDKGFYVDDRAIRPKEFIEKNIKTLEETINDERVQHV